VCLLKKDVDPDRPKRPQSAYFLWLNENRSQIKEQFPGISVTEVSKKAGEMWKEVTDKSVSTHYISVVFCRHQQVYDIFKMSCLGVLFQNI